LKSLEGLKTLEKGDKKAEKIQEDVSKNLVSEEKSDFIKTQHCSNMIIE
jgi:hypothetical protein